MNEVVRLIVITPTDSGCSVRAAVQSATSSSDMMTPPWTLPMLFMRWLSTGTERRAVPLPSSSVWMRRCWMKGMRFWYSRANSTFNERLSYDCCASIHGDGLAGNVARSFRSQKHGETLQVLVVAQPLGRGPVADQLTGGAERGLRHPRGEKSRADRVHRDAVMAPFGGEGAREVHQAALRRVVGDGAHDARILAHQAGDRSHVDHAAPARGNHRFPAEVLREHEDARQVQVDELVPGVERMLFGGRAPGGAGVVDEDVDSAEFLQHLLGARRDRLALAQVADIGRRLDLLLLKMSHGLVELVFLARGDRDLGAHFAERFGHLQPEPARAAGDERGASAKLEQLSHVHGGILIEFAAPMTTLAMFSGGLDSTAMLVQLLKESSADLRVHHIRMSNREQRADAEQAAVERIVPWCRGRYRPFRYSEAALDFTGLEAIPIDYLCIAFVACQVAVDTPGCHRIAVPSPPHH